MAILLVGAMAVLLLSRSRPESFLAGRGFSGRRGGVGLHSGDSSVVGRPGRSNCVFPGRCHSANFSSNLIRFRRGFFCRRFCFRRSRRFTASVICGRGRESRSLGPVWFFYCLLVLGMMLVLLARNAVLFLFAWELMAVASFFLVTFEHERESVREAGWIYFVATHLGTAFLLAFFLLLARETGSMDFDVWAKQGIHTQGLAGVLFLLAVIGFGTKAGFMPLHVWLPEAHPAAPSHVSALMSGVMIKTGIYGLMRAFTFLGTPPLWWGWVLIAIGLTSGVLGVLFALAQHDLKRLLAYHSVENIGIIALGLGVGLLGMSTGSPVLIGAGFRRRVAACAQSRLVQGTVVPRRGRGVARHRNA